MTTTSASTAATIERVLKPIQQFVRGWMSSASTNERGRELGLTAAHNQFWIVGRAGVLGDGPAEVAIGGLGFLGPDAVRASWNALPAGLSHLAVAQAYADCCTDWGRSELARFDQADMARLDELGRRVIDAASPALGSVFAGWKAIAQPSDSAAARVALTIHVLRELRGGAHIVAVLASGITPLDAVLASPAAAPRTGPEWAEHLQWKGPFRDPAEVRDARLAAERLTSELLVPAFGALTEAEQTEFADLVETTRNAIDM